MLFFLNQIAGLILRKPVSEYLIIFVLESNVNLSTVKWRVLIYLHFFQ